MAKPLTSNFKTEGYIKIPRSQLTSVSANRRADQIAPVISIECHDLDGNIADQLFSKKTQEEEPDKSTAKKFTDKFK